MTFHERPAAVHAPADRLEWPEHVRPGALRFAHASSRYESSVAFYRDLVGLPVVGEFTASFGEDGTIFGLPDTTVQLELVRVDEPSQPREFDYLVLYLDSPEAVQRATGPLRDAGFSAVTEPHPYWAANGAVIYRDPDGYEVVFAPWVYGRDPDPMDAAPVSAESAPMRLEWHGRDRTILRPLFAEAEDSQDQLEAYLNDGQVLVAWLGNHPVGHLQLVTKPDDVVEVKNMAVIAELRGTGIGRNLVESAISSARRNGAKKVVVATAAADISNLRFYQRCGFRFSAVERDAFTPDAGYPDLSLIDGIPLRDRVWLDRPISPDTPKT
jgi:GNAT superfamily N-acetyltransferase/catechol 2,3-dioxygenase-like lactoylglutathione lyase family enzyme